MNEAEAHAFVVDELSKHRNRNDILVALCNELGLYWNQAEQFVRDVESQQGQTIARRQSPLLIILGLGVILGGLGLTTYGVWYFWDLMQLNTMEQILSSESIYITAGSMGSGLAMIVGGIIGFRKIIADLSQ
ncbi:MAG: hypothetical protein M1608_07555 [Candidatus Omnitrophica bacterium]|nr:hypothetical protein [Candidatus Omnitrophota bacterium]